MYNVLDTEDDKARDFCGCANWTTHWEREKGRPTPLRCVVTGCARLTTSGGHVSDIPGTSSVYNCWIAPICSHHNKDPKYNSKKSMQIKVADMVKREQLPNCPNRKKATKALAKLFKLLGTTPQAVMRALARSSQRH